MKQQDGFIQTIQNAVLPIYLTLLTSRKINRAALETTKNERDNGSDGNETDKVPSKRKKTIKKPSTKKPKWSSPKPKSRLKTHSGYGIVKGRPGARFETQFIKIELEASLLYINEDMISSIVERTSEQVRKSLRKDKCRKTSVLLHWFERRRN